MEKAGYTVGFGITGSFCTFDKTLKSLETLAKKQYQIVPILTEMVQETDSRFTDAKSFIEKVESITQREVIRTIPEAEPIGPKSYLDIMVIAPCTGNTMAKLCSGIVDSPVLMAAKAHLRNEKPLVLSISTNDALGINFKNLAMLMNMKNIYFVPFGQDNYRTKPHSLIAHVELLPQTIEEALQGKQLQPVLLSPFG